MIAFDADDTLWHNESLFLDTQEKFRELLLQYQDAEWIDKKLYETEIRNLEHFGYGVKGFVLSMIETAIELTDGRISGSEIQTFVDFGKKMVAAPVEVLDGVQNTIEALSKTYPLMVITKGDLFEQETKVARSRLGHFFKHIEVVSEKIPASYQAVFKKYEIDSKRFMMVGNSLKSDVLPVLECGAHAVHVAYPTTWAHEQVDSKVLESIHFPKLDRIDQLPDLIQSMINQKI
jgi:putative hydrolase of the HAD superfamily